MLARLLRLQAESPAITSYYFELAEPGHQLDHIAGQYIELSVTNKYGASYQHWLTISSPPNDTQLRVTVRNSSSTFKQALQSLALGQAVQISQPQGDFVLPLDEHMPMVWIAGGIGITPFVSMGAWLSKQPKPRDIRLFHIVTTDQDALYGSTFAAAGVNRHVVTASTKQPHLVKSILQQNAKQQDCLFYVSGPEGMVDAISGDLAQAGVDVQKIVRDRFLGYA